MSVWKRCPGPEESLLQVCYLGVMVVGVWVGPHNINKKRTWYAGTYTNLHMKENTNKQYKYRYMYVYTLRLHPFVILGVAQSPQLSSHPQTRARTCPIGPIQLRRTSECLAESFSSSAASSDMAPSLVVAGLCTENSLKLDSIVGGWLLLHDNSLTQHATKQRARVM